MGRTSDSTMINKPVMRRMLDLMRRTINTGEFNVMNVKDMVTLDQNVLLSSRNKRKV
jgi:hypothetical protein